METLDSNYSNDNSGLTISPRSQAFLIETAKWANFLAIFSFVMLGLAGIFTLFGLIFAMMAGGAALLSALILVGFLVLGFFPAMYLFNFARKTKEMIAHQNPITVEEAFGYLKSYFKFVGIMTIIGVSLYIIMLLVLGGTGAMYRMRM